MEVNRQLSFSILPPGGPKILKCFIISLSYSQLDKSRTGRQKNASSKQESTGLNGTVTCRSFSRWSCCPWIQRGFGCPWTPPNLSESDSPRVRLSWLSSRCCDETEDETGRKITGLLTRSVFNEVYNFHSSKWEMKGLCFFGDWRCTVTTERWKPAFQWCKQPPIHNNKKAPSAVHWPAGPLT